MGAVCFSDGGGFIYKWGVGVGVLHSGGGISFGGGGGFKKNLKMRGAAAPSMPPNH